MWQLCHLYQRLSEEEKDVLDATQPIQKSCWCYEGMELLITPLTMFTHLQFTIYTITHRLLVDKGKTEKVLVQVSNGVKISM